MTSTIPTAEAPETAAKPEPQEHWEWDWWADWVRLRTLLESGKGGEARVLSRELAGKWPDVELLQHYARVLEPPGVRSIPGPGTGRDLREEYAWIREHAHAYPGCWLAIYGDRLIAADPDLKVVTAAVRQAIGDESALLH